MIPSVEQLIFGGTLGEEISASDGGLDAPPRSLPSSNASNRFDVALSPSAGESPTETPLAHPAASERRQAEDGFDELRNRAVIGEVVNDDSGLRERRDHYRREANAVAARVALFRAASILRARCPNPEEPSDRRSLRCRPRLRR